MPALDRHKVALDYLLDLDGNITLALMRQLPPKRDFTVQDQRLFNQRMPLVKSSHGTYGLVSSYSERDDSGLCSFHFIYEEGFRDEKHKVEGKWQD